MVGAKTQIIWGKVGAWWGIVGAQGMVGARLGHGWGKNSWGKVGERLGHGRGKDPELLGARLGHGWSKNSNNLGQGWGMVGHGAWLGQV